MRFGYIRVSTIGQNLGRQEQQLRDAGCERMFFEKVTGTKRDRLELNRMLEFLRNRDTVVVTDSTFTFYKGFNWNCRTHFSKRGELEKFKRVLAWYNNSTWENALYCFCRDCSIWKRFKPQNGQKTEFWQQKNEVNILVDHLWTKKN